MELGRVKLGGEGGLGRVKLGGGLRRVKLGYEEKRGVKEGETGVGKEGETGVRREKGD